METWDEDEAHCPRHEDAQIAREHDERREIAHSHIMSIRAMKEVLPPTDAYIKGGSGHSKGRKKAKKRARAGFGVEGWMTEETAAGIDK